MKQKFLIFLFVGFSFLKMECAFAICKKVSFLKNPICDFKLDMHNNGNYKGKNLSFAIHPEKDPGPVTDFMIRYENNTCYSYLYKKNSIKKIGNCSGNNGFGTEDMTYSTPSKGGCSNPKDNIFCDGYKGERGVCMCNGDKFFEQNVTYYTTGILGGHTAAPTFCWRLKNPPDNFTGYIKYIPKPQNFLDSTKEIRKIQVVLASKKYTTPPWIDKLDCTNKNLSSWKVYHDPTQPKEAGDILYDSTYFHIYNRNGGTCGNEIVE